MLILYRVLINLVFLVSPLIIFFRLIKKKEDFLRFKEKFCFFSKSRSKGKLIWFHGASVGELKSVIPLIEKLEKDKTINQILLTSNTLSSSKIIKDMYFKKVVHQFFPIDTKFLSRKFINYWKPSAAFFIDSEIWPNQIYNLKSQNIPIILINGRITKKTFLKWIKIQIFSKKIFNKIDLCLASSIESKKYLIKLGVKKVKFIGNLKFSQSDNEQIIINDRFKKFIINKKSWCASSTHPTEEIFCALIHKNLKKKYKNLLTIIIPRHVERAYSIKEDLEKLDLKIQFHESNNKISKDTDIYLVNSYGKIKQFFYSCNNVFLGGSIINHGGQNPLEAARYGCNIIHGPNVANFKEIFEFLKKKGISTQINSKKKMVSVLDKFLSKKNNSKKIHKKIDKVGRKILDLTYKETQRIIRNNDI
mgnify:CR=1 FL=1|tara:strand:- start:10871 stop:12127 length:1257 start_codon:yes stop_codon:yes gene_type:complete